MSAFEKQERCKGVKIWSRQDIDPQMEHFGWSVYLQFNRDLINGECSSSGCLYSGKYYSAYAKKTKSGMASIMVWRG